MVWWCHIAFWTWLLFGAKPLPEPMQIYSLLGTHKNISIKKFNFKYFSIKKFWKWHLHNFINSTRSHWAKEHHVSNKTDTASTHWPPGMWLWSWINNFYTDSKDRDLDHFLWNGPQVNVRKPHWWLVNIGSGNGLGLTGTMSLPEPILSHCYVAIWRH